MTDKPQCGMISPSEFMRKLRPQQYKDSKALLKITFPKAVVGQNPLVAQSRGKPEPNAAV